MSPASHGQKCHVILLWRSIVYPNQHRNMAEKKKKKRGGRRCVAGAPNSTTCGNNLRTPGISMHQFPKNEKTRALWVRFVQRHRSDFDEPVNQYPVLCSAHFEKSCFTTIQHKDTNHLVEVETGPPKGFCPYERHNQTSRAWSSDGTRQTPGKKWAPFPSLFNNNQRKVSWYLFCLIWF